MHLNRGRDRVREGKEGMQMEAEGRGNVVYQTTVGSAM